MREALATGTEAQAVNDRAPLSSVRSHSSQTSELDAALRLLALMMRGCCSMMRLHCFCRLLFGAIESYFCGKHAHGHTSTSGMLCGRDAGDYIALKRQALCEAAARGCCALGGERGGGRIASSGGRPPVSSLLSDARPSPGPAARCRGRWWRASRNPSVLCEALTAGGSVPTAHPLCILDTG